MPIIFFEKKWTYRLWQPLCPRYAQVASRDTATDPRVRCGFEAVRGTNHHPPPRQRIIMHCEL